MVTIARDPRVGKGVKGRRYLGSEILFIIILTVFVLLCVIPVIHVIALSLSDRNSVLSGAVTLWPKGWDINAYRSVFFDASMQRSMIFSIILTIVYTVMAMICSILIAYADEYADMYDVGNQDLIPQSFTIRTSLPAEAQYNTTLKDFHREILVRCAMCKPEKVHDLFQQLKQEYLNRGGQAVMDERTAAWDMEHPAQ